MATLLEIQAGRMSRFLQKLTGIKGTVRESLSTEVQPQISLQSGVENRYLESWDRFAWVETLAAGGVGNLNHVQFRNPARSNLLVVFEKIAFNASTVAGDTYILSHGAQATDLATLRVPAASAALDNRSKRTFSTQISIAAIAAADLAFNIDAMSIVAAAIRDIILTDDAEIPLLPGDAIRMRQATANQSVNMSFVWRERALEESELS